MNSIMGFISKAFGRREKSGVSHSGVSVKGKFKVEHWRNGKLFDIYEMPNGVTTEGKNNILDVQFHADPQLTTWYIGLINNSPAPTLAAADTMTSHAGWVETNTTYSEATRGEWTEGPAASGVITNAAVVQFTMTGTVTVYGVFLSSSSVKGGTAGKLWATASFAAPVPLAATDLLKITYTVTAT